jgi:hypothetical protein
MNPVTGQNATTSEYTSPPIQHATANFPVPQPVHTMFNSLPLVNHDQAMKRAKIQFSGLGDLFIFYNQLMNAMEQFCIYLVPLTQVKYQQSLCPTKFHGIDIDTYRK